MGRNFSLADLHGPARKQAEDQLIADTLRSVREKAAPKRKNKFNAVRTQVGDIWFDSKAEAARYSELALSVRAGTITDLELQPRFPLVVNGIAIAEYRADFAYRTVPGGERVIEDVKSPATARHPVFRIKKLLAEALHQIKIVEVSR